MEDKKKLTFAEKFAYGIGAVGKDMVYMLSASYVLYYFQDIMGVSAIAMGIILLAARVFDAFNDPIMGVIVARTKSRWGKFRPWLMVGTITNAAVLIIMFAAPPTLDARGLTAYAAVTYILWGVTYTMMDIPYWSMVPAFTDSGKERENLSALARSCAGVGSAIVTILTVMCVAFLGSKFAGNMSDITTKTYTTETDSIAVTAVLADALVPGVRDYLIAGHRSPEIGHRWLLEKVGKKPLLQLNMRVGEGTGAALAFQLVDAANNILRDMATFASAGISDKE